MTSELAKLYYSFWSDVHSPAYVENTVPATEKVFPHLTYSFNYGDWGVETLQQIKIWSRSTSFTEVNAISDKIHEKIPSTGVSLFLPNNDGSIFLQRGEPFVQHLPTEPTDIKALYVNVISRTYIL